MPSLVLSKSVVTAHIAFKLLSAYLYMQMSKGYLLLPERRISKSNHAESCT